MILSLALVGCKPTERFSEAQIAAMKDAGFTQKSEDWGLGLSNKILFGVNESELTPSRKINIQGMAKNLASTCIEHLRIDGHTDNHGKPDYNQ